MILKHIVLHNYRQHRDLEVDFTGNLIAIVGRNGSGKSNFLGAIQFALTGEQPGFNKEDLLTWGESAGYVELDFEHAGIAYKIQRRIEKAAATLTVGGKDKITGTKKVQDALDGIIGVDKDVMRQSVFVGQGQIDACLFADPRTREQGFQKLLGLGDAAKYNKFLTDFLAATNRPIDRTQEIAEYRANLVAKIAEIDAQKERLKEYRAKLDSVKSPDEANAAIADLNGKLALLQRAKATLLDLKKTRAWFDNVVVANAMASEEPVDVACIRHQIEVLKEKLAQCEAVAERNKRRSDLTAEIASAFSRTSRIDEVRNRNLEFDRKSEELVSKRATLKNLEKLLEQAPDGDKCPLCGSTVSHNIRKEIETERDACSAAVSELGAWISNHAGVKDSLKSLEQDLFFLEKQKESLAALGPAENVDADPKDIRADIARLSDDAMREDGKNALIATAKAAVQAARDTVARAENANADAMAMLPSPVEEIEMLDRAESAIRSKIDSLFEHVKQYAGLKSEVSSMEGQVEYAERLVEEMKGTLAKLESMQEKYVLANLRLRVVDDVKNWFKYSEGPRTMTQSVMELLTDEVNKNLSQFGSVFSVVPMSAEDGMGFRCVFSDGRAMSNPPPEASMLSGGQKIQLAVSFRLAVYSMFAAKLGLLSLDEPTAYLDDGAIANFADMLSKIKEIARNMGIQILISTHEAALGPVFDQTVSIS